MIPNIPRDIAQFASVIFLCIGLILIFSTSHLVVGVGFISVACWALLMSESILLSKVQNEMWTSLDVLRRKQAADVDDLLYFLRMSKISAGPFDDIGAAELFIEKLPIPAYIVTPKHTIHKINSAWTEALGWTEEDLVGGRAEPIQCPDSFGPVSIELAESFTRGEYMKYSRYCFINSERRRVEGTVAIMMFPNGSGAVGIFHPDELGIVG